MALTVLCVPNSGIWRCGLRSSVRWPNARLTGLRSSERERGTEREREGGRERERDRKRER